MEDVNLMGRLQPLIRRLKWRRDVFVDRSFLSFNIATTSLRRLKNFDFR